MSEEITYKNISIDGITYNKILALDIKQNVNEHAKAHLKLEVEEAEGKRFTQNASDDDFLVITTSAAGQPKTIFYGVIMEAEMSGMDGGYPVMNISLASTSYRLDRKPNSRTFQDPSMTYEQVMNKVVDGEATIDFKITDKPIGSWLFQNKETNWQFIKRLASQCHSAIVVNTDTRRPVITIGIPQSRENGVSAKIEFDTNLHKENVTTAAQGTQYAGLGLSGSGNYAVNATSTLNKGVLVTTYSMGDNNSFKQETFQNPQSEGKMMTGTVLEVKKEKIKVLFDSIDSKNDTNDYWFEYATPYATGGGAYGSGFYYMPEIGDSVRVFLPSNDESAAFAFGSVCVSPMSDPIKARWRVPEGQELLFTQDGIRITCNGSAMYIDMNIKEEVGITVFSDQDINIEEAKDVIIEGKQGVTLFADDRIQIGSSETNIELNKEKMVLQAEKIQIN